MLDLFWLHVAVSFVVAGVWISAATLIAEKLGSKIGGLVVNLPSNTLVAILFIAIAQGVPYAITTTLAIPVGMAIDTLFLFVLILLLRFGVSRAVIASLAMWFILASVANIFKYASIVGGIFLYLLIVAVTFFLLEKIVKIPSVKKSNKKYTLNQIIVRAVFAGGVVASTVTFSGFASPYWVGLFSTFPAVFTSTMVILSLGQSPQFARATGKIMLFSSTNILVYGLAVYYLYPVIGLVWGTLVSYICAAIWILLMKPLLTRIA